MISRWKTLTPFLALVLCLGWTAQASAAKIDYYSDGFYLQGTVMAGGLTNSANVWGSVGTTFNNVSQQSPDPSDNPTVQTYSQSGIAFFSPPGGSYVYLGMNANIFAGSSDSNGQMSGSTSFTTGDQSGIPGGYFLRIDPSGINEHVGDAVNLSMSWSSSLSAGNIAGSASTDPMSITLNGSPIMSYGSQATGNGDYGASKDINLQAQIGDIIGIFMGGSSNIDYTGIGDGLGASDLFGRSQQFIELDVPVPLPGAIWLLGSGLVGLAGLRWRLKK